jgi:hypothetical protein
MEDSILGVNHNYLEHQSITIMSLDLQLYQSGPHKHVHHVQELEFEKHE